ncbi:ATP-binding protein [Peribacillus asahii]|uniref:ATPase AAA n=1 Tax=Peribacillus asahii TaxID=228899 RepID=A0A3T0KS22_9BACI|nr:ATP-binding protein [Peribacillus asahii]AZV43021.1 ATPase AAA [Peribacillus asahii]USK83150.1 ATP-binding protein [Peribacillus asahii]
MDVEQILSIERPILVAQTHPVETYEYIIDTLTIVNLYNTIEKWIMNKLPGAIIYGDPRLGKTYAVKYLKRLFTLDDQIKLPIFSFNCRAMQRPNENAFFSYLLKDLEHELHEKGNAIQKRNRVFQYLLSSGLNSRRKQVLLFIDDAQRLNTIEYEWLMDIFNDLDKYDIKLTSILIGQSDLKLKRNSMTETKQRQIIGRFMVHQYQFTGIISKDYLAYLLMGYDEATEYPVNSKWSYTRYYFPLGFSKGKRLVRSVDDIWTVFEEVHQKMRKNVQIEIPMYYMTNIINDVFRTYGSDGENLEWITIRHWREIIINSSYQDFIESI